MFGRINGNLALTNDGYEGLVPAAVQSVFDQAPPAAFNVRFKNMEEIREVLGVL